jgi:hypothetical protein
VSVLLLFLLLLSSKTVALTVQGTYVVVKKFLNCTWKAGILFFLSLSSIGNDATFWLIFLQLAILVHEKFIICLNYLYFDILSHPKMMRLFVRSLIDKAHLRCWCKFLEFFCQKILTILSCKITTLILSDKPELQWQI